ncbi:hypothetical protein H4R34_003624 [Dimargaris verticillata]|uniref:RRM domain-containing protein n=1 Tax=Dimargaris verticillata TaxID=2761393 RepID=A0A9W8E821_9FUNG|nr:hypothetical protein H4R34_003624 [Dimargaris verticillata]
MSAETDTPQTGTLAPAEKIIEDLPNKVFVGNLSFRTNDAQLGEFFNDAGKVVQANVITRGRRSLGYGFVAFETLDAAKKAVAMFDKVPLDSREISVEVARPKGEKPSRREASGDESRGGRGGRSRGRGRRAAAREPRANATGAVKGEQEEADADDAEDAPARGQGRGRGRGTSRGGRRFPRRPRPSLENATPLPTTIFVANLPYQMDDDKLKATFADYNAESAKVIVRRSTGRSKGFGFVVFAQESDLKRALDNASSFTAEGRALTIRQALTEPKESEDNAEAQE